MIQRIAPRKRIGRMLACLTLVICCRTGLMAQNQGPKDTLGATLPVRHILGFEGISSNAQGDLSIQDNELQFRNKQGSPAQIAIGSIQDVIIGQEDTQVGGMPTTVVKTATPYGAGRLMSVFSHKSLTP
jgi:hypothetical protein